MATVVISVTFLLIARFYVCKMDAEFEKKRRARISARRETRWSMNSQRLEEIVAELMRPISDLRRSFDTDLSALLEEYLTEAGLHALDADEDDGDGAGAEAGAGAVPVNFAELALLLQQSACIYGRKVDYLYQHVLSVSDSLNTSAAELNESQRHEDEGRTVASAETPRTAQRRRRAASASAAAGGDFAPIELQPAPSARREASAPRPPPTLPRIYIELEPRQLAAHDVPLTDYADEPIGLLTDYHVAWRLQDGLLVEELERSGAVGTSSLRAIPLTELQAAIEANAPPSPPPLPPFDDDLPACEQPYGTSTPLPPTTPLPPPATDEMPPPPTPPPPTTVKKERKRKCEQEVAQLGGKLYISEELRRRLMTPCEFSVDAAWVQRVVSSRTEEVLRLRKRLREKDGLSRFRGFDVARLDATGFAGWTDVEASVAAAEAQASARLGSRLDDSDDDGFFEQSEHSSLGDSDPHRSPIEQMHTSDSMRNEWLSWQAAVVRRAAESEARGGLDVRVLARTLINTLGAVGAASEAGEVSAGGEVREVPAVCAGADAPLTPIDALLRTTAEYDNDVSRVFLATLFLANAGNVEVVQGAPLSLNSFSLRLLSTDERLFTAAVAADQQLINR